jgi:hypothetical protein
MRIRAVNENKVDNILQMADRKRRSIGQKNVPAAMNIISEVTGVDVKLNTYCCYQKRV